MSVTLGKLPEALSNQADRLFKTSGETKEKKTKNKEIYNIDQLAVKVIVKMVRTRSERDIPEGMAVCGKLCKDIAKVEIRPVNDKVANEIASYFKTYHNVLGGPQFDVVVINGKKIT